MAERSGETDERDFEDYAIQDLDIDESQREEMDSRLDF